MPNKEFDRFNHRRTLPGAPTALAGEDPASVQEDTARMADQCRHLGPVADEVGEYFGASGEGKDIKSIASFRIGPREEPVGVLNIDSSETNVLGPDDQFYLTFRALIAPTLEMLAPVVKEYALLYWRAAAIAQDVQTDPGRPVA